MRRALAVVSALLLWPACGDERLARDALDTIDAHDTSPSSAMDATASARDADDAPDAAVAPVDASPEVDANVTNASDIFVPRDASEPLGGDRPARVVLPEGYDPARSWPLVLLLHGYSAGGVLQDLYLGFSPTAARLGFVTIVPDGTTSPLGFRFWNTSPGWCCDFWGTGVDDAGYLVGLVDEARRRWHIDAGRVYAFGHSNGGFMAHKLACAHAEVFAAVGSLAGSLPIASVDCAPSRPVSVLEAHGTLDATIQFGGTADYPGAQTVASRWASYDTCDAQPEIGDPVDYDRLVPGAETIPSTWSGCGAAASVALWTMKGSGHVPAFGPAFVESVLTWLDGRRRSEEGP